MNENNPYIEYGLRRLILHTTAYDPKAVLTELTPGFVHASVSVLGSAGPLLDDLLRAFRIAADLDDVPAAFKFSFLRDAFAERTCSAFLGLKAALRARAGEHRAALEDVEAMGNQDDQVLVRAERYVHLFRKAPKEAKDEFCLLQALAESCSPEVLDLAVIRIADASPKAAIGLAMRIPEPRTLDYWNVPRSAPTKERCLWEIAKKKATRGLREARDLRHCLHTNLEKAIFLTAAAIRVLCESPREAIAELKLILTAIQDETSHDALEHVFVRYILWYLPEMTEDLVYETYQDVFDLSPLLPDRPEFCRVIDAAIRKCPDGWTRVGAKLPDGFAKLFLLWRLAVLGYGNYPSGCPDAPDIMNDILRAQQVVTSARQNISASIPMADTLRGLAGISRTVTGIIDLIRPIDPQTAELLASHAFRSWSSTRDLDSLDASLVLLRSIISSPSQLRTDLVRWCMEVAEKEDPRFVRTEARCSLGQVLAKGFTESAPNAMRYWGQLLRSINREEDRSKVACRLLEELPFDHAVRMSRHLDAFQLFPPATEHAITKGAALFLPETQALLLRLLAERIGETCPSTAADLLRQAARAGRYVTNEDDRQGILSAIIKCAITFDPATAWDCYDICPSDCSFVLSNAQQALNGIAAGALADIREAFLRLKMECLLSLDQCRHSEANALYMKKRLLASESLDVPPLGRTPCNPPAVAQRWQKSLIAFVRGYFARSPGETDLPRPWCLCEPIGLINWKLLIRIVKEPELGRFVCRGLPSEAIRQAALAQKGPARAVLEDVRAIERAAGGTSASTVNRFSQVLIAAAASCAPDLCVMMLRHIEPPTCWFPEDLHFFTTQAHWPDELLFEVFKTLSVYKPETRAVKCCATLLRWIGCTREVPSELLCTFVQRAYALGNVSDILNVAKAIGVHFPHKSQTVYKEVLRQSIRHGDTSAIARHLTMHESPEASQWEEWLQTMDATDRTLTWEVARLALTQTTLNTDEALRIINMTQVEGKDIDNVLALVAERLTLRDEKDLDEWLSRLEGYLNLNEETSEDLANRLLARGFDDGLIRTTAPIEFLTTAENRLSAYCRLLDGAVHTSYDSVLTEALREIRTMPSAHDRFKASVKLARCMYRSRPARAMQLYEYALKQANKLDSAALLMVEYSNLSPDVLSLPSEHASHIAEMMYKSLGEFPRRRDLYDTPDMKAQTLVRIAAVFEAIGRPQATDVLTEAIAQYCKAIDQEARTSFEASAAFAIRDLLEKCGLDLARGFLNKILTAAPQHVRSRLADGLRMQFSNPMWADRDEPLRAYDVLQKTLTHDETALLTDLLSACSPENRTRIHLALGVSAWFHDPDNARTEIERAIRLIESHGAVITDEVVRDVCVAFAICQGYAGLSRSIALLTTRKGLLLETSSCLIAVMINASEHPRQAIEDLWRSGSDLQEYLSEA